jgi:bifunctional DNA-binding transcriptional regulator/antitoxin component of YhaV-PrlF toxin-antitoxin module
MVVMNVRVGKDGRITIPKSIRDVLVCAAEMP